MWLHMQVALSPGPLRGSRRNGSMCMCVSLSLSCHMIMHLWCILLAHVHKHLPPAKDMSSGAWPGDN